MEIFLARPHSSSDPCKIIEKMITGVIGDRFAKSYVCDWTVIVLLKLQLQNLNDCGSQTALSRYKLVGNYVSYF